MVPDARIDLIRPRRLTIFPGIQALPFDLCTDGRSGGCEILAFQENALDCFLQRGITHPLPRSPAIDCTSIAQCPPYHFRNSSPKSTIRSNLD